MKFLSPGTGTVFRGAFSLNAFPGERQADDPNGTLPSSDLEHVAVVIDGTVGTLGLYRDGP